MIDLHLSIQPIFLNACIKCQILCYSQAYAYGQYKEAGTNILKMQKSMFHYTHDWFKKVQDGMRVQCRRSNMGLILCLLNQELNENLALIL